jgi:photosystem II stability/assembly factor-like uncharacterized protein
MRISTVSRLFFLTLTIAVFCGGSLLAQNVERTVSLKDVLQGKQGRSTEGSQQGGGVVPLSNTNDVLVNNNNGATATGNFTQSETDIVAWGNFVVIAFNDAGSYTGSNNQFTGWSYSTNGGVSFTDGGTLPVSTIGDAGDPVLARNETTGRIYFSTLGFNSPGTIQMFRSDDNGVTWMAPVNATPGGSSEDKQWHTVDNFPGTGNGNVYVISRNFGGGAGIYLYRSTDHGATFGPSGGVQIVSGNQGAFVAVGPDHAVYAFWYTTGAIMMRKSTDFGVSFGSAVTVASGLVGGVNGDLGLTGIRQGTTTPASFRSSEFPHAAINPINGNVYVTYANDGPGVDKADVFFVQSTNGGTTWSSPLRINDDATTTDQWQPTIAVSPNGSQVGIFYYSREGDPVNNNLFKYHGRIGAISGATITWEPSFPVSDVASLPEFGRDSPIVTTYMGDYNHAVATPDAFHVVWSDNRDDHPLPGGFPRKDPNVYYKRIPTTQNFGWVKGTITNTNGGAPVEGIAVDFVESVTQTPGTSNASGLYYVGALVDTPGTTANLTMRARKFAFVDTTIAVVVTRFDTLTRSFSIRPAPSGTLEVRAFRSDSSGIRANVKVYFGQLEVVNSYTDSVTGNFSTSLPAGSYSMIVDPPSPYGTRNFPSVTITAEQTTHVDAMVRAIVEHNPAQLRDTLAVGQSNFKNLQLVNTSGDSVQWRVTAEGASIIDSPEDLKEKARSMAQQPAVSAPKGAADMGINPPQVRGRGGPDAFGYVWIDSDEPGGPVFNWVEIKGVGTQITGIGDDTNVGPFTIGFPFPFYGNTYTGIRFCTNGFLSFTSTVTTFTNTAIPATAEPNNALYPFWDDLNFNEAGGTAWYYYDAANQRFIIQYDTVSHYLPGTTPGRYTFQVILKPSGEILYQYRKMEGTLNSATIGIENLAGTIGLQTVFNAPYVHDNLAISIRLRGVDWLSFNPSAGVLPPGGNANISATFDATGLTAGTTYEATTHLEATHPDVQGSIAIPTSLRVQLADSATLNLNPLSITFPGTRVNFTRQDTVTARNIGGSTLNITSITTTNPFFTVNPTSATILSGDSVKVIVTYAPTVAGSDTGRAMFMSNSFGSPRLDVLLSGTAVGTPDFQVRVDSLVRTLEGGRRDSILFYMRNVGTGVGNFAAQAIMYPRTGAIDKPMTIPTQIVPAGPQAAITPEEARVIVGRAPRTENRGAQKPMPVEGPHSVVGEKAFGYEYFGANFVKFNLSTPGTLVSLGTFATGDNIFAGDFSNDGNTFLAIKGSTNQLIRIDTTNGSYTVIGAVTIQTGHTWTSLRVDPDNTWYATSTNGTISTLYTINPNTGATTVIGTVTNVPILIAMAIHPGTGQMYAYDIESGGTQPSRFFSINKTTGAGTLIGSMGFIGRFAQDMDFDPETGILYAAAYNFGASPATGELRTINISTGASTLIGNLGVPQREVDCFAIKGVANPAANWFAVAPASGTVAIDDSVLMKAYFDATTPGIYENPGNYYGRLEVRATNSTLADTLRVPVRMFVVPPDSATLTVNPNSLDFEDVELGTNRQLSVLVRNIGAAMLNVTNITQSDPSFSANPTSFSLAFNDTQRVQVTFTATAPPGTHTGTMSFVSNDPGAPSVSLAAHSFGIPHFTAQPDTFFRFLQPNNDTTRAYFTIRNTGTDTLQYMIQEYPGPRPGPGTNPVAQPVYEGYELKKGEIDSHPGIPPVRINGRGGPDAFGYVWIDSDEPGGPAYNWVEIKGVGTQITGIGDDTNVGPFTIGFPFPFYGNTYTGIRFCTNGFLSFTSTVTTFTNTAIPATAEPNNALYPFWDDLNFNEAGGTAWYYYDAANQRFIIQYDTVSHYLPGTTPGRYTFQVILKPSGEILYQYRKMLGTLNSATIGIENSTGTIGLQTVFNAPYVHDNLAILFTRDVSWMSTDRTAGTIAQGDSQVVELRYHPAGMLGGDYDAHLRISGNTPDVRNVAVHLRVEGVGTITVTSPNGGEQWVQGQSYQIAWTDNLVDSVKIEYSTTGNGGPWTTIVGSWPSRPIEVPHPKLTSKFIEGGTTLVAGTYNWLVPNTPSANCYVRVSDKTNASVFDMSNNAFAILASAPPETTWTVQTSGTSQILYSVKAVSQTEAWAAGAAGAVVKTVNGGTNWTNAGPAGPDPIYAMTAVDDNIAFVGSYNATVARLWRTTNGGSTWTIVDSIPGGFINGIHMFNATNGYYQGDPVGGSWILKRTTNGGASWVVATTLPPNPSTEAGWNNSLQFLDNQNGWFGTNASHAYYTTDGGTTWTASTTAFVNSYAVWFNALSAGLTGASTGATNRSTDGGVTWTAAGSPSASAILGMSGVTGSQEFWATAGNNAYYSSNFGTLWVTSGPNGYAGSTALNHVSMKTVSTGVTSAVGVYGWAVGNAGFIVRYRRTPVGVDEEGPAIPTVYALDQNYPNPFNPTTTIRYALPVESTVKLKVFNILGQEVATLVNGEQVAGYYDIAWDGKNANGASIASGVYFFRIDAKATGDEMRNFTQIKKMIMLK